MKKKKVSKVIYNLSLNSIIFKADILREDQWVAQIYDPRDLFWP